MTIGNRPGRSFRQWSPIDKSRGRGWRRTLHRRRGAFLTSSSFTRSEASQAALCASMSRSSSGETPAGAAMAVAARDVLAASPRPSLARAERRLIVVGKPVSAAGTVMSDIVESSRSALEIASGAYCQARFDLPRITSRYILGGQFENGRGCKENRIRRKAARRGYKLEKSNRRDPLAVDFGLYHLTSAETGGKVAVPASSAHGATADEIEEFLDRRIVRPGSAEDVVLQALRALAITSSGLAVDRR